MSTPPPLRLNQRDDAAGAQPSPRLNVAAPIPNRPISTQAQHAPRIGTANRYS